VRWTSRKRSGWRISIVVLAGVANRVVMDFDQRFRRSQLHPTQAVVFSELDARLEPELRFAVGARNVHVRARFFAREEEQPEAAMTDDRRAQSESMHAVALRSSSERATFRAIVRSADLLERATRT